MIGRPSIFSDELAAYICEQIANGRSLREVLRDDEGMPGLSTVFQWLSKNQTFADQYAYAREVQAETLVDEIIQISDDGSNDYMQRIDGEGGNLGWKENGEAISRSKLRVDARKWVASKLLPKKYGDRLAVDNSGVIGVAAINAQELTDEQLAMVAALPIPKA